MNDLKNFDIGSFKKKIKYLYVIRNTKLLTILNIKITDTVNENRFTLVESLWGDIIELIKR